MNRAMVHNGSAQARLRSDLCRKSWHGVLPERGFFWGKDTPCLPCADSGK